MVVDYAAYKWWSELTEAGADTLELINQYYTYVFKGIDLRFQSIDDQPFRIDIGLVGIYVAKSENESEWTSGSTVENGGGIKGERLMVNSSEALEKFQIWIDVNEDLPKFDHAVLFSGTNLTYAGSPGNTGLAFASSMCRNISNSSIVEDSFDFRTITYASQQIARSLGTSDDMDNNDCLEFFNYIMTPKLKLPMKTFPSNRWSFSSCSRAYFQEYLDTLNEDNMNCLLDTHLSEKYPPELVALTTELPGQQYAADEQCVHAFGLGSFVCRTDIKNKYKTVCYGLPCYVPDQKTCQLILPADGTPCGDKKYCMKGKCNTFEDADELPDTCPYGNAPKTNCSGISIQPYLCYQPFILYDCCDYCLNVSLNRKGCEFGDRISSCTVDDCLERGGAYSSVTCCLTCEGITAVTVLSSTSYGLSAAPPVLSSSTQLAEKQTIPEPTDASSVATESSSLLSTLSATNASTPTSSSLQTAVVSAAVAKLTTIITPTKESEFTKQGSSPSSEVSSTATRIKRSSLVALTKALLKTVDPLKSPATAKPIQPNGYQVLTNSDIKGSSSTLPSEYSAFDSTIITKMNTAASEKRPTEPSMPAIAGTVSESFSTKTDAVSTRSTEQLLSDALSSATGVALSTPSATTLRPRDSLPPMTQQMSPPTTTCPTPPEKDWDKNLSSLNRRYFSKLAITMRQNQRAVLYEAYLKLQIMYRDINDIFKERKDAEATIGSNSDSPSFDNADILQIFGPVWRKGKRDIIISLNSKLKNLRYKVLALTKSYLTGQITK